MKKPTELIRNNRELISYLFWGVLTTVVSWGSYALFAKLFAAATAMGQETLVLVSNILSWVCAVLFAFVTNKIWVFRSRSWAGKLVAVEMLKFVASRAATGAAEILLVPAVVWLGIDRPVLGITGGLAKIIVSLTVVIVNYVLSKFLVFTSVKKKDE